MEYTIRRGGGVAASREGVFCAVSVTPELPDGLALRVARKLLKNDNQGGMGAVNAKPETSKGETRICAAFPKNANPGSTEMALVIGAVIRSTGNTYKIA